MSYYILITYLLYSYYIYSLSSDLHRIYILFGGRVDRRKRLEKYPVDYDMTIYYSTNPTPLCCIK
jgi:hypothetical protein